MLPLVPVFVIIVLVLVIIVLILEMEMLEEVQNSKSRLVGLKVNSPFSVRVSPILPPYSLHSLYFLLAIFLLFFFISFFKIHMIIRFRFNTPPSLSIRIQFLSFLLIPPPTDLHSVL